MALSDYEPFIEQAAKQYNIDPGLLRAQLLAESSGNANAVGPPTRYGQAEGIAQIMPHEAAAAGINADEPGLAINYMARQMRANLDKYRDERMALMAYYGGPNQKLWGPKTKAYPDQVLLHYTPTAGVQNVSEAWPSDLPTAGAAQPLGGSDWPSDLPVVQHGQSVPTQAPELRSATVLPAWERIPALAEGEFVHGALATAGIPGNILSRFGINAMPTSSELLEAGGRLGITDQTAQLPQNETERTIGGAASGLGGAAVAAPIVALAAPEALTGLAASGIGGGALSELARYEFPNNPIAPVGGGLVGGVLGGELTNLAAKGANALAGEATPEAKAFGTLGLTPRSPAYTAPEGTTSLVPSGTIRTATENELEGKMEQTAAGLGESRTLQQAGEKLQEGAQNWLSNTLKQKVSAAWAPVDSAVPANMPVPLTNFTAQVSDTAARGGSLREIAKHFRSENFGKLAQDVDAFATRGENPSWQDVMSLRQDLGEAIGNPKISESIGGKQLRAQYKALTDDMRAALPPDLVPQFNYANSTSQQLYDTATNVMGKVVRSPKGNPGVAPESVASSLLSGGRKGATTLAALQQELPGETGELAAVQLRRAALSNPALPGAGLSDNFGNVWDSLPEETKDALYPDLGTRARIDAAARIAQRTKAVGTSRSNLATAATEAGVGSFALGTLAEHVGELGARVAGGQTSGEIFGPGSAAYIAGAVIPPSVRLARNALANSSLAARYAGVPGVTLPRFARPWMVGSTIGAENLLYPYPQAGAAQPQR